MHVKYIYVYVHNFHESPCLLQFSSMDHFTPGTYFKSEDLCNPEIDSDDGCVDGQCEKLRRGLCALPPFKRPRTLVKKFRLKNDHNTQLIKLLELSSLVRMLDSRNITFFFPLGVATWANPGFKI